MDAGELAVARVAGDALGVTAEFLLDGAEMDETDETSETPSEASKLPPATRCVLLRGEPAKALMPDLKLEMTEAGFEPAVFGAFTPAHAFLPLGAVAGAVVAAHERYWDLGAVANDDDASSCVSTAWPGEEAWSPTIDPVCVMSCVMDAARVPDPQPFPHVGGSRGDEEKEKDEPSSRTDSSAVVVLDGVVGEPLRAALLDAFTEPGWPHLTATGPPPGKWVRETNDGVGALPDGSPRDSSSSGSALDPGSGSVLDRDPPNSWGLSATALAAVARSPSVQTVLARLGALYPEYVVRFMPADALEPEGVPGAMSALFGNGNDDAGDGDDGGQPDRHGRGKRRGQGRQLQVAPRHGPRIVASLGAVRREVRAVRQPKQSAAALRLRARVSERARALDPGEGRRDARARSRDGDRDFHSPRAG
jgi:probable phosphoglycerate mutase